MEPRLCHILYESQALCRKVSLKLHTQRVWQATLGPKALPLKSCPGVTEFSKRSITQTRPQADAGALNGAFFTTEEVPAYVQRFIPQGVVLKERIL
jgi:hypothetical protein